VRRCFPCRILLLVDDSEEATLAAEAVVEISTLTGSELHVAVVGCVKAFHAAPEVVWEQGAWAALENETRAEAGRVLSEQVRKIEECGGEVAAGHLLVGHPIEEIIRLRELLGATLVIVGDRETSFVKRSLTKSVGEEMVRRASCNILVVHAGGPADGLRLRRRARSPDPEILPFAAY
jgi:nucleotide-binding universal stress UspA family protein